MFFDIIVSNGGCIMLKQKDWVNVLVEKLSCSKKDAKEYYDLVFDNLKNTISPTENIKISGFGVMKLRKTMPKEQINLVTGNVETVPEHNVITFKPYFALQPKPTAIEVEGENIDAALDAAAAVTAAAEAAMEEERAKEAALKEQEKEETTVEEVVEESAPVEEEKVEATPVVELENLVWVYGDQSYTENEIKKVLMQKTELSEVDVDASLAIVKNSLRDVAPHSTTIKVVEEKETFNFIFDK